MAVGRGPSRLCVHLAPHRRVSRPCEMVRKNGEAALLFVVDSQRTHSERRGRPGAPGALSAKWPYVFFVLVHQAFPNANRTRRLAVANGRNHSTLVCPGALVNAFAL